MELSTTTWLVTVGVAVAILLTDIAVTSRRPHVPTMRETLSALALYIGLAIVFGVWVAGAFGADYSVQFFAGWLTEYSLSVDNLFVFLLIMARFAVPRDYQQTALMVGIILALVLRGAFIAVGAAAISAFSWVFYVFGIFLLWTAWKVGSDGPGEDEEYQAPRLVTFMQRILPVTDKYHGVKLSVVQNGAVLFTPMMVVLIAIGVTDVLFAVDSIPAIFGQTQEPYLVLMANIFALMGLRQLYFLLGRMLDRLVFLHIGLAVLLAFIGVKLIIHALAENELTFINHGHHVTVIPEIPTWLSLVTIVGILATTAVASLVHERLQSRTGPVAGQPS